MEQFKEGQHFTPTSTSERARFPKNVGVGDGRKESPEGETINPFEIPVVVATVAGYVDYVGDLKSVRSLNSVCMKETLKKWRNSAVFIINDETFPVLVKAFIECVDVTGLTEAQKAEALAKKDPFQLKKFPFKKYRFAKSQAWTHPLEEHETEKELIWEKCIKQHATYLDVGECKFKGYTGLGQGVNYFPGLKWILSNSPNVTEFAMAPSKSSQVLNTDSSSSDAELSDWFRTTFKAPQIHSFILSAIPQNTEDENAVNFYYYLFSNSEVLAMLPNLKALKLPRDGWTQIMRSLRNFSETKPGIQLESIDALEILGRDTADTCQLLPLLLNYLDCFKKSFLREIRMPLILEDGTCRRGFLSRMCEKVQESLVLLEVVVNCETNFHNMFCPIDSDMYLEGCSFPNLTHVKVHVDYDTFRGKVFTFDFKDLKKMPKLREFHLGSKSCVEKTWVTRKLDFLQKRKKAETFKLPDLKSLHFHGNFKKEALRQLGRIAGNLETLELVFDQENFAIVKDVWPSLNKLKLLPCSDVPEKFISNLKSLKTCLSIVDESENKFPAIYSLKPEGSVRGGYAH